jgi:hypothetical protein
MSIVKKQYRKQGRSGSYERGFKFTTTIYEMLYDDVKREYSMDNGKTWGYSEFNAWKLSERKDRVKISGSSSKEFAFDAIQKINKSYDPTYKWHA